MSEAAGGNPAAMEEGMKRVKLRALTAVNGRSIEGEDMNYVSGQVFEVDAATAKDLLNAGFVEAVKDGVKGREKAEE